MGKQCDGGGEDGRGKVRCTPSFIAGPLERLNKMFALLPLPGCSFCWCTYVTGGCGTLAAPLGCRPSRPSRNLGAEERRGRKKPQDHDRRWLAGVTLVMPGSVSSGPLQLYHCNLSISLHLAPPEASALLLVVPANRLVQQVTLQLPNQRPRSILRLKAAIANAQPRPLQRCRRVRRPGVWRDQCHGRLPAACPAATAAAAATAAPAVCWGGSSVMDRDCGIAGCRPSGAEVVERCRCTLKAAARPLAICRCSTATSRWSVAACRPSRRTKRSSRAAGSASSASSTATRRCETYKQGQSE